MPSILHVIDSAGPGGAETVLTHLVRALNSEGWLSRVLVAGRGWLYQRLCEIPVDCRVVPSRGKGSWRGLQALIREIKDFEPDLVHAHLFGAGVYSALASRLSTGAPLVCTFHGKPDVNLNDPLLPLKAWILSHSKNRIVYVSHDLRRHLEPVLGHPPDLGLVIHNGVPFPEPEPGKVKSALQEIDPDARIIGAIGNVRPAKDYSTLIRAAKLVCSVHPNVHLVIFGGGPTQQFEDLRQLAMHLGIRDRVHLPGFRDDVHSALAAFEIFVSSSETEGLPLASVEAMALGKPVVLTDCGGVPELVEHGVSGLLVPVGDPMALAEGVLRLLGDPELAGRLGAAAKAKVLGGFSLGAMLKGYTTLYRALLND